VKKNPMALAFLDEDVRQDRDVVNEAYAGRLGSIEINGKLGSCSGLLWRIDKDSAKWAVGTTQLALEALAEEAEWAIKEESYDLTFSNNGSRAASKFFPG